MVAVGPVLPISRFGLCGLTSGPPALGFSGYVRVAMLTPPLV